MVKFVQVNPSDIDIHRLGRRGRVSYPLLKSFLEANMKMAELDLQGFDKNPTYLRSVLTSYIKSHKMPIKLFQTGGKMYLMRLDIDNEGNANPDWKYEDETTEGNVGGMRNEAPVAITPEEVAKRFNHEKHQITK